MGHFGKLEDAEPPVARHVTRRGVRGLGCKRGRRVARTGHDKLEGPE